MEQIPVLAMIIRSGWVARIILLLLALMSIGTWAVIFYRWSFLARITRLNSEFMTWFESIKSITDIDGVDQKLAKGPLAIMGRVASSEYNRIIADAKADTGVRDWSFYFQTQFTMASDRVESAIVVMDEKLSKGLVLLAMSSAIGPFLGLLGTVWGIMDSFFEIGEQGSASLPVVAPGIAEALITTVLGLVVAIPALFFYNIFTNRVEKIINSMDSFAGRLSLRLKRDIFSLMYRSGDKSGIGPRERL
jgi:biopolymer transport protein TolQ